jgi:hypothetical protein
MATNFTINNGSPFKIKRPVITTSGIVSDVDATVKSHLDELNQLLDRRIFTRETIREELVEEVAEKLAEQFVEELEQSSILKKAQGVAPPEITVERSRVEPDINVLLSRPLTPKKIPENTWTSGSLADVFKHEAEAPDKITLSEYIDMTAELSSLKYAFQNSLAASWINLDYNTKAVLDGYSALTDYLIAFAYHVMGLHEVNGLKSFIMSNKAGVKNIANYAIVSAARKIIDKEQLKVPGYDDDASEIVTAIKAAKLSISSASFKTALHKIIDDFIFNSAESKLIDNANIGVIPLGIKPLLIKYIKNSPVPITPQNVQFFLPLFISQIQGTTQVAEPTEVDTEESDKDFDVQFLEDDKSLIQISQSAVKCAAQLYYVMTLGDELDVFNTVNYFTHKYLIRGGIEIQDSRLREDLQQYVFSNRFLDLKKNKLADRTRPAERQMFYTQVFNQGNAQQATGDLIPNQEFTKLWKVLVLESAKYLERAQASPNPDSYVSRQNVMQSVEDLQYNLSTHCTGMANVITPLIYAELNFVIQRIFMHPEVLRQVVPAGGTWWRVVETLYMGMKNVRPKATVLYNKAKLGHDIIRSIADYNPATFEDDKNFSAFISNVDAFITTQSILQESLSDDLRKSDDDEEDAQPNAPRSTYPEPVNAASGNGSKNGHDEWDF